jgi:hypothetical protein
MIVRLLSFVILACAALAGYQAFRLSREPLPALTQWSGTERQPAPGAVSEPAAPSDADSPQFAHLVARPPFSPDRRPFEPTLPDASDAGAASSGPTAPAESLRGRLLGVISDGTERFAVLATANSAKTEILRRGSQIDGWNVEKIDDNLIVLRKGAALVEIPLFEDR